MYVLYLSRNLSTVGDRTRTRNHTILGKGRSFDMEESPGQERYRYTGGKYSLTIRLLLFTWWLSTPNRGFTGNSPQICKIYSRRAKQSSVSGSRRGNFSTCRLTSSPHTPFLRLPSILPSIASCISMAPDMMMHTHLQKDTQHTERVRGMIDLCT